MRTTILITILATILSQTPALVEAASAGPESLSARAPRGGSGGFGGAGAGYGGFGGGRHLLTTRSPQFHGWSYGHGGPLEARTPRHFVGHSARGDGQYRHEDEFDGPLERRGRGSSAAKSAGKIVAGAAAPALFSELMNHLSARYYDEEDAPPEHRGEDPGAAKSGVAKSGGDFAASAAAPVIAFLQHVHTRGYDEEAPLERRGRGSSGAKSVGGVVAGAAAPVLFSELVNHFSARHEDEDDALMERRSEEEEVHRRAVFLAAAKLVKVAAPLIKSFFRREEAFALD